MRYFDSDKINKGKKYVNISMIFLILSFSSSLADSVENIAKGKITFIITIVFIILIILYYKGNKFAEDIVFSMLPIYFVVPALLMFLPIFYLLRPFGILNILDGWSIIIIMIACIVSMYFLLKKIGWFECIEEYRLYKLEKRSKK